MFGHHGPTRSKGPASFEDKLAVWTRPEDAREKWSKAEDGPFRGLCRALPGVGEAIARDRHAQHRADAEGRAR